MANSDWRPMNDYYWIGPPGWTICRVKLQGKWHYELWQSGDPSRLVGSGASLEAMQQLHKERTLDAA